MLSMGGACSAHRATAEPQPPQQPLDSSAASEVKNAMGEAEAADGAGKSPRRVPMPFSSLMSPRKSGSGASPRGPSISVIGAGAAAPGGLESPLSVSPTPAPTPDTKGQMAAQSPTGAGEGGLSVLSPGACVWDCLTRLCGDAGMDAEDEDELEVATPVEHQLAPVFRRAGIPAESADVYMGNLRSQGFDNVLALRHLAQDRFRSNLGKFVPDRMDRKRLIKALGEELGIPITSPELPPLPPTHLPIFEWVLQLLSLPQEVAMRYAEALRGLGVHTGAELLQKEFGEVEPALVSIGGILPGHRKAIKVVLKHKHQQQRK